VHDNVQLGRLMWGCGEALVSSGGDGSDQREELDCGAPMAGAAVLLSMRAKAGLALLYRQRRACPPD
jgi:hypothetical protein